MAKVTLKTLANLENQPSAVALLNFNFAALATIIDSLLSRDGTVPNTMQAALDMNANRILNLPVPVSDQEPARHGDIQQYVDTAHDWADYAEDQADRAEAEADDAEESANEAATNLTDFLSRYVGAFSSDPTVDGQGNTLQAGALYFNTVGNYFRVFALDDVNDEGDPVYVGTSQVVLGYWITVNQATLRSMNDVSAASITNNQLLQWNTGQELFLPFTLNSAAVPFDNTGTMFDGDSVQEALEEVSTRTSLGVYDLSFWLQGLMSENEILYEIIAVREFTLPVSLTGSLAKAGTAAQASTTVFLKKNGTQIGTVNFAASATSGTFTMAAAETFAVGDILSLVAPASPDTSLRDVVITLIAQR